MQHKPYLHLAETIKNSVLALEAQGLFIHKVYCGLISRSLTNISAGGERHPTDYWEEDAAVFARDVFTQDKAGTDEQK